MSVNWWYGPGGADIEAALATRLAVNGSNKMLAPLNAGGYKVINVVNPTVSTDAATKAYVDSHIGDALLIDGSNAMAANLNMKTNTTSYKVVNMATPTADTDAATKAYVDTFLPLAGGIMTGPIAMGTTTVPHKITNLAAPTAAGDAVNKSYADSLVPTTASLLVDGTNSMRADLNMGYDPGTGLVKYKIYNLETPTTDFQAANKSYVDSKIAATGEALLVDGSNKMNANLNAGSNRIYNVSNPQAANDAVNASTLINSDVLSVGGTTLTPNPSNGGYMTSNTLPVPFVASNGGDSPPSAQAYYAFDGNPSTAWLTQVNGSSYISIDLGSAYIANSYVIRTASVGTIASMIVYTSNDNVNFTTLPFVSSVPQPYAPNTDIVLTFLSVNAYRYYNLNIASEDNISGIVSLVINQGVLNVNNRVITNVGAPQLSTDASTKEYVDAAVQPIYNMIQPGFIVPIMTSDTTPPGYVSTQNNTSSGTLYPAWKAFTRGTTAEGWLATVNPPYPVYMQITLPVAMTCQTFEIQAYRGQFTAWNLSGSNDGTTFTTLYTSSSAMPLTITKYNIITAAEYLIYRLTATNGPTSNNGVQLLNLYTNVVQFNQNRLANIAGPIDDVDAANRMYVDNAVAPFLPLLDSDYAVPVMTSNTTPTGYIITTSSAASGWDGWHAFTRTNGGLYNEWTTAGVTTGWLKVQLPAPIAANGFSLLNRTYGTEYFITWLVEGSNNNSTWDTLYTSTSRVPNVFTKYTLTNTTPYSFYRFNGLTGNTGSPGLSQFNINAPVFNVNGVRIINVDDPINISDAATKNYVDNIIAPINNNIDINTSSYSAPIMTSDTTPAGYICSASSGVNSYFAFDRSFYTYWVPTSTTNQWCQIQLPTALTISKIELQKRVGSNWNSGFTISGSTNGTNFTVLYTGTVIPSTLTVISLTTTGDYTYYRFTGTLANLTNAGIVAFNLLSSCVGFYNNRLINVSNPINAQDSATKNYVDTTVSPLSSGLSSISNTIGNITASLAEASINFQNTVSTPILTTNTLIPYVLSPKPVPNPTNATVLNNISNSFRILQNGFFSIDAVAELSNTANNSITVQAHVFALPQAGTSTEIFTGQPFIVNQRISPSTPFVTSVPMSAQINITQITSIVTYVDISIYISASATGVTVNNDSGVIYRTASGTTGSALLTDGSNSMTANLNVGTNRIVNVVNPSGNQDAATKIYVDSAISNFYQIATWRTDFRFGSWSSGLINMVLCKIGPNVMLSSTSRLFIPNIDWNAINTQFLATNLGNPMPAGFTAASPTTQNRGPYVCWMNPSIPVTILNGAGTYMTMDYYGVKFDSTGKQLLLYNWEDGIQTSKWVRPVNQTSFEFGIENIAINWITSDFTPPTVVAEDPIVVERNALVLTRPTIPTVSATPALMSIDTPTIYDPGENYKGNIYPTSLYSSTTSIISSTEIPGFFYLGGQYRNKRVRISVIAYARTNFSNVNAYASIWKNISNNIERSVLIAKGGTSDRAVDSMTRYTVSAIVDNTDLSMFAIGASSFTDISHCYVTFEVCNKAPPHTRRIRHRLSGNREYIYDAAIEEVEPNYIYRTATELSHQRSHPLYYDLSPDYVLHEKFANDYYTFKSFTDREFITVTVYGTVVDTSNGLLYGITNGDNRLFLFSTETSESIRDKFFKKVYRLIFTDDGIIQRDYTPSSEPTRSILIEKGIIEDTSRPPQLPTL